MILAGHGKDPRLVQTELPVVPNVGDRIREDCNSTEWANKLKSLITEGEFIGIEEKYGSTFWKAKLSNGKFALMAPEDTVIIDRAPVLVETEISLESLLEPFKKVDPVIELPFDCEIPDNEKGNECYTPAYVLDLCRDFLKGFDLDPFSNVIAQRTVKAETFWTKTDNSLTKDWCNFKRKWCNPPYRKLASDGIIDKILSYIHIGETLLLVNSSTSAKWFHKCMDACTAYLHPNKRIPFYNPYSEIEYKKGKKRSGNEHDQTLFYFGDRPLEFAEALSTLGNAVQPIKKLCLPTSTSLEVLEPLALQPVTLGKSRPSPTLISAKTRKKSINPTSIKSPSIPISEITIHPKESIYIQEGFPAQEPAPQVAKLDLTTKTPNSGLNTCDASTKDTPNLSSSKILLDYYIGEWERSSQAYPPAGMMRSGKFSALPCLEVPKKGKGCLSLPTLTSNMATDRSRASGQSKLEKWLKDNDFLQNTQVLNAEMMAILFGFPKDWTKCLSDAIEERLGELDLDIFLDGRSISTVQPLSSNESSTLIAASVLVVNESSLDERLVYLQSERDRLISSGASPKGVWLEKSKPAHKPNFVQVVWKSDAKHPWLADNKSRYIGKENSDEHLSAIAIHQAGQELRKIEREIKNLEKKL